MLSSVNETDDRGDQSAQRCPAKQEAKHDANPSDERHAFDQKLFQGQRIALDQFLQRTFCHHVFVAEIALNKHSVKRKQRQDVKQHQPFGAFAATGARMPPTTKTINFQTRAGNLFRDCAEQKVHGESFQLIQHGNP
ncbi:MAG TPA: hypothetical protein VKU37_10625 [Verrucomicrobiae bacterium]|nr:hypothetical protein [Verrucomicrobiae bacterium]